MLIKNDNAHINVMFISEGTFPYIKGGVSTWIYQLITGLPHINFGVVFLGGRKDDYGDIQYELPKNLVYLSRHFIFEGQKKISLDKTDNNCKKENYEDIAHFHNLFRLKKIEDFPKNIQDLDFYSCGISETDFMYGMDSWRYIESEYNEYSPDSSFTSYFWTIRNSHSAIWKVADIAVKLPQFDIIHSPSTGYAGFMASLLKFNRKIPFILTEHGIYTKERKIDILTADWIKDELGISEHLKDIWSNFFEFIGRFCYKAADTIISLFNEAKHSQIGYGAPEEKTAVIPNGVDIKGFSKLIPLRKPAIPKVVSLIGRVVPIKDIKTFIKSVKLAAGTIPDIKGWIVGPEEEDPDYVKECRNLTAVLGLENNITFFGFRNIKEILPETGILTLTSISEGMPLIVLEGFAAGVPSVCTDVGACRQLIYGGLNEDDLKIGKAGEIAPTGGIKELSEFYVELLTDEEKFKKAQKAGLGRVKKFYTMDSFLENYSKLYRQ